MSNVFVLDTNKEPLNPVHSGRARVLLTQGKAAVFRRYPFTIILKTEVSHPQLPPLRLKLDPGSQTTGIALVNDATGQLVWAAELSHRGQAIKKSLDRRRGVRRGRRHRHSRYRQPRFQNRRRKQGWVPPSLESRMANVLTWTQRLMRLCPLAALSMELVKFDTQAMQNPEIKGTEYSQGTLFGYEVREYLLAKWERQCSYCQASDVALQVEHIQARSRGGSDRVSNLCLACGPCNHKKGSEDIRDFLKDKPDLLARILAQAKASLKDASVVNSTRWALYGRLKALGLPVECGSGGLTKYNRVRRDLPKTHWLDAACVGKSTPEQVCIKSVRPLLITAVGRQHRQMCLMNKDGFPRTKAKQSRMSYGFQTGDIVKAVIPVGKHAGAYTGSVAIRSRPTFGLNGFDVHAKYLHVLHRADGYSYQKGAAAFPPTA